MSLLSKATIALIALTIVILCILYVHIVTKAGDPYDDDTPWD